MSKSRLFCIGRVVATRAGNVSIPTNLVTSGSFRVVGYLVVTESINYGLCNKNIFTNRAVLSFGKTSARACRIDCFIDNLGMSESVNVGINVGISAMASVGSITFFGASRFGYNRIVRMPGFFYGGICSIITTRAGNISVTADFGAGRSFCIVFYLIVTKSFYSFLCNKGFSTAGAFFALGKTSIRAGRGNRIKSNSFPS